MHVTQHSCQENHRKISTDKHTHPRSSTTLGDKPITAGSSDCCTPSNCGLTAPGQSIHRRQTTPRPCKLPHFLQKYPSSNPQIRNNPHRKETPPLALRLPPGCHQARRTGERNQSSTRSFPIQRAEGSNIYWTVLWTSGCCVTSEWSEISQGECVLPKVITEARSLLTHKPFLTLGFTS